MRRRRSIIKTIAGNYQRKATIGATSLVYEMLWGEKPKRGRRKKREENNEG